MMGQLLVRVREIEYISDLLPSGSSGFMLGLTFGRSAGETNAELVVLTLPRFLLVARLLLPSFFSFRRPAGVLAVIGDNACAGLLEADIGLLDGVLNGPSLGVLRAGMSRGVGSCEFKTCECVAVEPWFSAASGSSRSSKEACPIWPDMPVLAGAFMSWAPFIERIDFGVAAGPETA